MPDFWSMLARKKYNLPDEWRWITLSRIGDDFFDIKAPRDQAYSMVKGAVYKTEYLSGKNKGKLNFKKPEPGTYREVVVSLKELDDFIVEWEKITGWCGECYGNKINVYKLPCEHCHQTGRILRADGSLPERCTPQWGSCTLPAGHEGQHSQFGPFKGLPLPESDDE